MPTLPLMVTSVHVDAMEVTKFGDVEPDVIPGRTRVVFTNGNDSFEIDWTYRGEVPEPGSRWTLSPESGE